MDRNVAFEAFHGAQYPALPLFRRSVTVSRVLFLPVFRTYPLVGRGFLGHEVHLPIRVLPLRVESQTRDPLGGQVTRRAYSKARVSQGSSRPCPSAQALDVRSQRQVNSRIAQLPRPTALHSSNPSCS
jgi:hypothetical protein